MNSSASPFVYFLILFVGYVLLEVLWVLKNKESFLIYLFNHFIKAVLNISEEVINGKKGQKFCGIVVAIETLIAIGVSLIFLHNSYVQHDLQITFYYSIPLLFFIPALLLLSYYINSRVIAHCNKNFS